MEPRLAQVQTQKLILSPQIRQYLRLLQLPLLELQNAVEQELADNPALEEAAPAPNEDTLPNPDLPSEGKSKTDELQFDQTLQAMDAIDASYQDGFYAGEDLSLAEKQEQGRKKNYQESLITPRQSLFDYLLWQLGFLDLTEKERKLAEEIIGDINEDGFFTVPLEEIAKNQGAETSEAETVLREIQRLDPPGIGARNLQETLLLQLKRQNPPNDLAFKIVQDHMLLLVKKQWDQIARRLKATNEQIQKASGVIGHLDPKPGHIFHDEDSVAIKPDAEVFFDDSTEPPKLKINIEDEEIPEVRVSPYYRRMLRDPKLDPKTRAFLKGKLQSAIDFVKALSQRRSTLRGITEEIVAVQTEFFEKGFSCLKPLRMKDISERLGIHESTVSRALQSKYISTPQGTISYKSFFSAKLDRVEGGVESQKSMMEKIRDLIAQEDPVHPLSDQDIMQIFQKEGIKIARRTVAKYRELLKILPSHLRRQHYKIKK